MPVSVAVITTPLLKDFAEEVLGQLPLDCTFTVYLYHSFQELPELYASLPQEVRGVLTSGVFPAQVIQKSFPDTDRVIAAFNNDDISLYRMILNIKDVNPTLDLERIYIDFVDLLGLTTREYLLEESRGGMDKVVATVGEMTLEQIIATERAMEEKHRNLWQEGKVDLAISRFSSIIPALQAEGVNIQFSYPSRDYVAQVSQKLLGEIRLRQLRDNQPAVINISLRPPAEMGLANVPRWEAQLADLQRALLEFLGSALVDVVLQKGHFGYEIITSRKRVEKRTDGFRCCTLKPHLAQRLEQDAFVGYGLGADIYQARLNALNANKEATLHAMGDSFLMDEQERLVGPLTGEGALVVPSRVTPEVERTARGAGLSTLTVAKVASVLEDMGTDCINAQTLADKLSITPRSANRFLKGLVQAGAALIVTERSTGTRGRPERTYRITIG